MSYEPLPTKKSPPRLVLKNEDKTVSLIYIVGDGLKID
jgi:hypothetical protein